MIQLSILYYWYNNHQLPLLLLLDISFGFIQGFSASVFPPSEAKDINLLLLEGVFELPLMLQPSAGVEKTKKKKNWA
jgi:hypothetical protein